MAEWLKAAVLKTVSGVTHSGVRIPLPPPRYKSFSVNRLTEDNAAPASGLKKTRSQFLLLASS
jgi:hypothetical protein